MRRIDRIRCGNANCFLMHQDGRAILIDTSRNKHREKLLDICRKSNVTLIVLTHGHVDHIQNAAYLSSRLNIPIAMHKDDYGLTKDNTSQPLAAHNIFGKLILALSRSSFEKDVIEPFEPSVFLEEGDSLAPYGVDAVVVGLPGHTKGSIGLNAWGEDLIVGDALMNMFYPTKSMLYNDPEEMERSAGKISNSRVMTIHFGHGKSVHNRRW